MIKAPIKLTAKEGQILHDICLVRRKALQPGKMDSNENQPLPKELKEQTSRQALHIFDFFRSAMSGNMEAIRIQLRNQHDVTSNDGTDDFAGMISDYNAMMVQRMQQGNYTMEDALHLQSRIKGYVRTQKTEPARILYIADCHFYHDRICREMDHRGFSGYEEMNAYMIQQWNKKVRAKDQVYILGDFSISKPDATENILGQLNGKLQLIRGNHDKYLEDRHYSWYHWFRTITDYTEISDYGRKVILSHYPVFCYKGQYRKDKQGQPLTYMLYGHVHNTQDEALINRFITETRETKVKSRHSNEPEPISCNMINCFCMFSDYQPMTLDEWIRIDTKRRAELNEKDQ